MQQTIYRTLLHGAGCWAPTEHRIAKMDVLDRKFCKRTLKYVQLKGETEEDFHKRLNQKVTQLQALLGWQPLSQLYLKLYYSWVGHAARIFQLNVLALIEPAPRPSWRAVGF